MSSINLNNTSFTSSGTLRFSGISSGIDFQSTIDAIIESRRAPIRDLQDKITLQESRKTALEELRVLSEAFTTSLDALRGDPSSLNTDDVFQSKLAFTTAAAVSGAPADHTPSAPSNLIGVTAEASAAAATHTVVIDQLATAQQIRSDAFTSLSDNMTTLGVTTGTMTLNGETITIAGTDTLNDVRDKINNSSAGVSATIVTADATTHYLVISSDETGTDNAMSFTTDFSTSDSLGFTTGGDGTIKTELRAAQNSIIDVNGIENIERSSNTVSDVLEGVTFSLFAAESNTQLTVSVENDLTTIKSEITNFTTAYNAIRDFVTDQRTEIDRDGDGDTEYGALAFDSITTQMVQQMGSIIAGEVEGLTDGFQSLSQIGISIDEDSKLVINDATLDTKLLSSVEDIRKLFTFDFQSSDSRLTYLSHDGSPSYTVDGANNSNPYYLNVAGIAGGNISGGNVSASSGNGTGTDGTLATISGKTITVGGASEAEGLRLFFNGEDTLGAVENIEFSFTRGVADSLYYFFEDLTEADGTFDTLTTQIDDQVENFQLDIGERENQLTLTRTNLEIRFIAMETALAELNAVSESLSQFNDALNQNN